MEKEEEVILDMIGVPGEDMFDLIGIEDEIDFGYMIGDEELFEIFKEKVSELILKQDSESMEVEDSKESELSFEEVFQYLVQGAARIMKDEAESKFIDGDTEGALADAYIASGLDPNLPGIERQIAAYKVHVAASVDLQIDHRNSTKDWYAILGFTDEDDDFDLETIRKRHRKLASMVHPDKNESAAAKTAIQHVNNAKDYLVDQPDIKNFLDRKRVERKQNSLSSAGSWPSLFNPNEKQFKKSSTPTAPPSSWTSLFDLERMKQEKPSLQSKPRRKTGMPVNSPGEEVKFKSGYSKSRFYCQKEADYSSDEDMNEDCEIHECETVTCPHCSSSCEVEIQGGRISSIITCKTCKRLFVRDDSI